MSRRPGRVDVRLERAPDHVIVRWSSELAEGSCRFDHVPGATPEWIGAADELLEGADRRLGQRVLDAMGHLAEREGLQLGIWHDDAGVEVL